MASAEILSQVEGLLQQCVAEYGDDPRVSQLLDDTRALMHSMKAEEGRALNGGGPPPEAAPEAGGPFPGANEQPDASTESTEPPVPEAEAPSDFKGARKAAMESGIMQEDMRGPKNKQPKTPEEEQADKKKRQKSKA